MQHDYAAAADLAAQGFEEGPISPMGVQLAYYEANSAALLGDQHRAQQALQRADQFADALRDLGAVGSPWAFPAERRAIFQLSVLLRTGDPAGALIAAQDADHAGGWPCEQFLRAAAPADGKGRPRSIWPASRRSR